MSYAGLVSYESYLRAIARNMVFDRLRTKSDRWLPLENTDLTPANADPSTEPGSTGTEELAERRELRELLVSFAERKPC